MLYQYHDAQIGSLLAFTNDLKENKPFFLVQDNLLKLVWNRNNHAVCFQVDDQIICLEPRQIVAITFVHHLELDKKAAALTTFAFNREFYCMQEQDSEVSCYGVLFFGAQHLPIVTIPPEEVARYEMLYDIFVEEFQNKDNIQGEMLHVLLKRLIIKCTRLAHNQTFFQKLDEVQTELVRKYNFLVDIHYKTKKQVADYAEMLNKSPKTLSNIFKLHDLKTPQQIIHDRIALESKRFLLFTDKSCKEIAYMLGFDDPTHFSKFFKKIYNQTPLRYKNTRKLEN